LPDTPNLKQKKESQLKNKRFLPAHERVFQILSNKIMIAPKWEKSPNRRKIFIFNRTNSTSRLVKDDGALI